MKHQTAMVLNPARIACVHARVGELCERDIKTIRERNKCGPYKKKKEGKIGCRGASASVNGCIGEAFNERGARVLRKRRRQHENVGTGEN